MTHMLMTTDTLGGVWTYSLELAGALAPMGVTVSLATMGRPMTSRQRQEAMASAVVDVHESNYALEWMKDPWPDVAAAGEWLLSLAERERPDLVHLNGYAHAALPWELPTVVVAHSCVLSWWAAVHGGPAPREWDDYRARVAAGLAAANQVVAPTRAMLEEVGRCYGTGRGVVIPNGRRSDWAVQTPKEPVVLGSGRIWDEAKNLSALGRVAGELPWPVVLAGEATHPDAGTAADCGPVRLLGRLAFPELAEWLGRVAVFALPARYEPFGLGALEAGLAGCALVLGDIASLREVWGDSAVYVDPDDDESLLEALAGLARDPALVADLGHRARRRALELSPERSAAGYLDVYRRLPVRTGGAR